MISEVLNSIVASTAVISPVRGVVSFADLAVLPVHE